MNYHREVRDKQTPNRARRLFTNHLPAEGSHTLGESPYTSDDDTQHSPFNDISNDIQGDSSITRPLKRRGVSKGIGDWESGQDKMVIVTNEYGQPIGPDKCFQAFQTRLGIIARRDIPICYQDWRKVPSNIKNDAIKCLDAQFRFDYQESVDSSYTRTSLNDSWRNYKHELYVKYVKNENPSILKERPPPNGIPIEDWHEFVDNCNSPKYQSSSTRGITNRKKQKLPSLSGRRPASVVRHKMAVEKGVPDAEIGRSLTYKALHTKKDNTPQCPEVTESIDNVISSDPGSQVTSTNDAIAQTLGPDSRGRFRGMGTGVCKTKIRMMDPLLKKNVALSSANLELGKKIENVEAKFNLSMSEMRAEIKAQFDAGMNEIKATLMSQERTSSPLSHSSTEDVTMDRMNIGKECNLRYGWPPRNVAKGVIQEVCHSLVFGQRQLGEDNYKVHVNVVYEPNTPLPCPHNEYFTTLGQIGQGSVIWPKEFLRL